MTFIIEKIENNNGCFTVIKNSKTGEYLKISNDWGGTVVSSALNLCGKLYEVISPDQDEDFIKNPLFRGRMLFPFNDRIPDAQYTFGGKTLKLPSNIDDGSAIHGLIYKMKLEEVERIISDNSASVTLFASLLEDGNSGYPFNVELKITYTLLAGSFKIDFNIYNGGQSDAPYALGWHPYFTTDNSAAIYGEFSSYVDVDDELLPTGENIDVKDSPYDFSKGWQVKDRDLDLGFVVTDGITTLKTADYNLIIDQDNEFFPYTQMYIPDDKKSVAIEPITAATNSFNIPSLGLRIIPPGDSESGSVRIIISQL
ncbi:MAG: aldose 1-epimerase [Deltaproteobacteria bacterium]|nr:aldose 1-epimerase [Deltaproteobacteria bacterium]